jgi:geranylgeranyl diphosphate synthase type II
LDDYVMMIGKKTARMISAASEMGAIIGGGTVKEIKALREFGKYLGLAFQIQDDILDIDGSEKEFGKVIGRDIMEGKRTYLLLTARERVKGSDARMIGAVMRHEGIGKDGIGKIRDIYERRGVLFDARKEMERTTLKAQTLIRRLPGNQATASLLRLSNKLLERQS